MTDNLEARCRMLEASALHQRKLVLEIHDEAVRVKLIEPCPTCASGNVSFLVVHSKIMEALAKYGAQLPPEQKSG